MEFLLMAFIVGLALMFFIKGAFMVFWPEAHFLFDQWLRGNFRAHPGATQPGGMNLQWRVAGLIFMVVSLFFGKIAVTSTISKVWSK